MTDDETDEEKRFPAEYINSLNSECKRQRLKLEAKQREYEDLQAELVELQSGPSPEVVRLTAEAEDLERQLADMEAAGTKKE